MADRLGLHGRPLGRLLRLVQQADPQQIVETLAMTVAELGGSDVVLYLIDYDHSRLTPLPVGVSQAETSEVLSLEGSMAGRVFQAGTPLTAEREDGWQVWVLVAERAQKLGVLSMTLPTWDDSVEEFCVELGMAAGHVVRTADAYTDRLVNLRRRKEMSLAAEIQWGVLPPLTFTMDGTTVAGLMEPAYEVGGDSFDYSFNGDVLDVAMFDAMGHGLHSASLGVMTMSAYRNTRREHAGAGVLQLMAEVNRIVADFSNGEAFVTALMAQLEVTTGQLRWASAGHPDPVILRESKALPPLSARHATPLGLQSVSAPLNDEVVVEVNLQPGDSLLFYTDGVVDGRNVEGQEFGEERLTDFVERESMSGRDPAEVLRRVVRSVIDHNGAELRDDASLVYLRWDSAAAADR